MGQGKPAVFQNPRQNAKSSLARQFVASADFQLTPTSVEEYQVLKQKRGERSQGFLSQPAFAMLADGVRVETTHINLPNVPSHSFRLRVYQPADFQDGETLPVIAFFHGGFWCAGDVNSEDLGNRAIIARGNRVVILSFEYRLIPTVDWKTQFSDVENFVRWAAQNAAQYGGDVTKGFLVAGAEAGAHLAAISAIRLHEDTNIKITGQVLIVPATIAWPDNEIPTEWEEGLGSHKAESDSPLLPLSLYKQFLDKLNLPESERRKGENFPVWADLKGLPPAYLAMVRSLSSRII